MGRISCVVKDTVHVVGLCKPHPHVVHVSACAGGDVTARKVLAGGVAAIATTAIAAAATAAAAAAAAE